MSPDRRTDKEEVVRIHNRILLGHEKERNKAIWQDAARDYHTKGSHRDEYRMISLTRGI